MVRGKNGFSSPVVMRSTLPRGKGNRLEPSPLLYGRQEGELLLFSCPGRSSGLWGWSRGRSGSSRVTPVCCHRGWGDVSRGWLSPPPPPWALHRGSQGMLLDIWAWSLAHQKHPPLCQECSGWSLLPLAVLEAQQSLAQGQGDWLWGELEKGCRAVHQ